MIEALAFGCTLDGYGRFTEHSPMLLVCTRVTVIGPPPVFVNVSIFETMVPGGTLPKSKELAVERNPVRGVVGVVGAVGSVGVVGSVAVVGVVGVVGTDGAVGLPPQDAAHPAKKSIRNK